MRAIEKLTAIADDGQRRRLELVPEAEGWIAQIVSASGKVILSAPGTTILTALYELDDLAKYWGIAIFPKLYDAKDLAEKYGD